MSEPIDKLFDAEEIDRRVAELARRLDAEVGDDDPLYVGLLGGSVIFVADLVRELPRPVRFEFVDVGYRQPEVSASELLEIRYPLPVAVEGQTVLVVKDVTGSGVTETYLAQQFLDKGARRVGFVALIDMPEERKTDLAVDYQAFSLERSAPLVGYGLKLGGRLGNLPYLGRLLGTG